MAADEQEATGNWGPLPHDLASGAPWQHYTLMLGGKNRGPFEEYTQEQREHLLGLGPLGWELVGVTTLQNGWLLMAFKRPWGDDYESSEPPEPFGLYL